MRHLSARVGYSGDLSVEICILVPAHGVLIILLYSLLHMGNVATFNPRYCLRIRDSLAEG